MSYKQDEDIKTVIKKSIIKTMNSTVYSVTFDDGTEYEFTELDNIKSSSKISSKDEFIKNADVNSKIKKDDFEYMSEWVS